MLHAEAFDDKEGRLFRAIVVTGAASGERGRGAQHDMLRMPMGRDDD